MVFSELEHCPFCGHDEFYTKAYYYGNVSYRQRYDGREAENTEMHDGLRRRDYTGRCYCVKCNRYLGNIQTDIISNVAANAAQRAQEQHTGG